MLRETMVLSPELSIYHLSGLFPVFREDSFVFLIWKGSWAHFPTQRVIKSSAEIVCVYEEDFTWISDYLFHQSKNKSSTERVDVSNNAIKLFNSFISTISQAASLRLIAELHLSGLYKLKSDSQESLHATRYFAFSFCLSNLLR